jgi:hypothetical protein
MVKRERRRQHKSVTEQRIARCAAVTEAYRSHAESTRQGAEAAADLGIDEGTFNDWLSEARKMGWLSPNE